MTDAETKKPVLLLSGGRNQQAIAEELASDFRLAFMNSQIASTVGSLGADTIALEQYADGELVSRAQNKSLWFTTQIVEAIHAGELTTLAEDVPRAD